MCGSSTQGGSSVHREWNESIPTGVIPMTSNERRGPVTQTRRFSRPLAFAVVVACLSLAACTGPATQTDGNRGDADTSNGPTTAEEQTTAPRRDRTEWACPTTNRAFVIYARVPPDPETTLDEAIASSPGLSHAVLKRSRRDAAVVVFLPGTGLVVSKQSVHRWPNGGWALEHHTTCRSWLRKLKF
jgi:hypothetical protein